MKKLCIIGLILCFILQALNRSFVYINFKIHQQEIARNLCVKRAESENTCQGKCHLKKMMAKEVKEEKQSNSRQNSSKENYETLFLGNTSYSILLKLSLPPSTGQLIPHKPNHYDLTNREPLLHPPRFLAQLS